MKPKFKIANLPHGGKIYYVKNTVNKHAHLDLVFRCGARVDTIPGISHFVEHLFFAGTDKLTKEQVAEKCSKIYWNNAYTTNSVVGFNGEVEESKLPDLVKLFNELITTSTFTTEAIEKEKGVVKQEIILYKTDYDGHDWYNWGKNIYGLPFYEYEIVGSAKSVDSIKREDVLDYVNKWFVAENLIVFVSTPLSFAKTKKLIVEELESKLKSNKNFKKLEYFMPPAVNTNFYVLKKEKIEKTYLRVSFVIDRNYTDINHIYQFDLVRFMMQDSSDGLTRKLRIDKSLVYYIECSAIKTKTNTIINFETSCSVNNVNEIFKTIAEYIKEILKTGFPQNLLDKIKQKYIYKKTGKQPDALKTYDDLRFCEKYEKPIDWDKYEEQAQKITLEQCNEMFKEVFTNPRVSASIYGEINDSIMKKAEFMKLFKFDK